MIRFELKKAREHKKIVYLCILFLFTIYGFFFCQIYRESEEGFSRADVSKAYELFLKEVPLEHSETAEQFIVLQKEYLENQIQALRSVIIGENIVYDQTWENNVKKLKIWKKILEDVETGESYPAFLEQVEINAEKMAGTNLFFQKNSFARRYSEKTADIYKNVKREVKIARHDEIMLLVTDNIYVDLFLILFISVLVMGVVTFERSSGLYPLLHASVGGRKKLIRMKLILVLFFTACAVLITYLPMFITVIKMGTKGFITAPLQSLPAFLESPFQISIGTFIVIFLLVKILAYTAICSICFLIAVNVNSYLEYTIMTGLFAGFSVFVSKKINSLSALRIIGEISPASWIDGKSLLASVGYVNLGGYPVSRIYIQFFSGGVIMIICCFLAYCSWLKAWRPIDVSLQFCQNDSGKIKRVHPSVFFEWKKMMTINKSTWILLIMSLLLILVTDKPEIKTAEQYYYRQYANMLKGPVSDETLTLLKQEENRMLTVQDHIMSLGEKLDREEISGEQYEVLVKQYTIPIEQQYAFEQACRQYEVLKGQEDFGVQVDFLDESGWQKWFGEWGKGIDSINLIWTIVLLILCFHNVWTLEREADMIPLIRSSPDGIRRIKKQKISVAVISTCIMALIPVLNKLYLLYTGIGLDGMFDFNLSVVSISIQPGLPSWCPIGLYILLKTVVSVILAIVFSLFVIKVSEKADSRLLSITEAIIVAGIILVFYVNLW